MNKSLLVAVTLLVALACQRRPDPRSVPKKVQTPPAENIQAPEKPTINKNKQTVEPPAQERPARTGSASQTPPPSQQTGTASQANKNARGADPSPKPTATPSPASQGTRTATPEPVKETRSTKQQAEPTPTRSTTPTAPVKEPEIEIKRPSIDLPREEKSANIPEVESAVEGFAAKFSKRYENFVGHNIDLFERIVELFREKILPYYTTAKENKIVASIVIGFIYTFIILRFALKIFPSKSKIVAGESKNYDKQFERLESLIRESASAKSEVEKKLDAVMKKLVEFQTSFEAFKKDKADDEFLDFLGKNIEDVWKEIGVLKSRNNDVDSSNLDSLNARFEPRPANKNDKEGTPEEIDFDNEKFKFDDIAKISKEDNHSPFNDGSLPSAIKSPMKPVANTLLRRPAPVNTPIAIPSIKTKTESLNEQILTSNQPTEKEQTEHVRDDGLSVSELVKPNTLQQFISQPSVENVPDESANNESNVLDEKTTTLAPPKPVVSNNIFANRNRLAPKSKNHITMPSISTLQPPSTTNLLPVPPSDAPVEEERVESIVPNSQQNQQEMTEALPEESYKSEIQQTEELPFKTEEPPLVKPPLIGTRLPPVPNLILKAKPKPPQMVKPLPKIQPSISDNKGGDRASLI